MSEFINNSKIREAQLKQLIRDIHKGLPLEEAKIKFKHDFGSITTEEIVALEQSLIADGMAVTEVMRLCDVHAAVFDGSIEDIHKKKELTDIPGHPAKIFKDENNRLEKLIKEELEPYLDKTDNMSQLMLRVGIERLMQITNHYARKEYLFFPGLEKKGINSIPQVMWGVDDEIREMIKSLHTRLGASEANLMEISQSIKVTLTKVKDMIVKENNILLPKLVETLSFYDWIQADKGSADIGYFLEKPQETWAKEDADSNIKPVQPKAVFDEVKFDAGALNPVELNSLLNTLPFDMTFVDKDGNVKYFTQGKERIFSRPLTIIGRHVSMCHPPKSVHIVEAIVESFRSGKKDHEDFWINMGPMFVYIRYFAVRDKNANYLGTLEVTQNIKPIRELEGEKRLVSE